MDRAPLRVEAAYGGAVLVEGDGIEDHLFAGLDLDVTGKDFDLRNPPLSVLSRLDRLRSGAALSRRALAVPALRLSLGADVGQVFIAKPLHPGRPSARMPPEAPSLPGVDRLRRYSLNHHA